MPKSDNNKKILEVGIQAAFDYLNAEVAFRNATYRELTKKALKEIALQLGPTAILAAMNAYFFVDPALKYGLTEDPDNPVITGIRDSVSAALTNFVFAVYACTTLFNELRKPYGKRNQLIIACVAGIIAALPTVFMHLMEVPNPSLLQVTLAVAVAIGAVPVQATGILRGIKSIGTSVINLIKTSDRFGSRFGNPEIARAQLELTDAFLETLSKSIEHHTRFGNPDSRQLIFSVEGTTDFLKHMLFATAQQKFLPTLTNKYLIRLNDAFGIGTGGGFSIISLVGTSVPFAATYFGIRKLFSDPEAAGVELFAANIATVANLSTTGLAMIFGFSNPRRLYHMSVDLLSYFVRSAYNRKFEKPHLPIEIEMAKIASFIFIPLAGVLTFWSYATMERLLQDIYVTEKDNNDLYKIVVSSWMLTMLQVFVKTRSLIFNLSGVVSVFMAAGVWLTRCFAKFFGSVETSERIIVYEALQQISRVYQEATAAEFAQQLCENFPASVEGDELIEVTGFNKERLSELRTKVEDGKELQKRIDDLEDQLDTVNKKLAKCNQCFSWLTSFWKKPSQEYLEYLNAKNDLQAQIKKVREDYKNYTYETRHEFDVLSLNDDSSDPSDTTVNTNFTDHTVDNASTAAMPLLAGNEGVVGARTPTYGAFAN